MNHTDVLNFWFTETDKSKWWVKDHEFDNQVRSRFLELYHSASKSELYTWRTTAQGRLAEIILLDQFSRNMFRDKPQAFAADPLALALAQEAISAGVDSELNATERSFLYMPFMHSESLRIHQVAVTLYTRNGIESNLKFELRHKEIIEKFGRYPHRNSILNRKSSNAEIDFLKQPGSSF